ncbi:hypothetical protein ACWERJ_14390, partial [Streptomyces sp. NPDC004050]
GCHDADARLPSATSDGRRVGPGNPMPRSRRDSRLTVVRDGRPLLDQELACGPGAPGGWDGPAGLAGHRAVGQLLVVDPRFAREAPAAAVLGEFAAVTPLAGPAVLVTALAPDALRLRGLLDAACRTYGW